MKYGEDAWDNIRRLAGLDSPDFAVHQVYPEQLLGRIAKKAFSTLGCRDSEFFEGMGAYFVELATQYGYGDVLAVLGRTFCDFLMGLDNLHEYLKFSYPKIRAPSYFVTDETEKGMNLHYRSKRRGFVYYTQGQLKEIASKIFNLEIQMEVKSQEVKFDTVHVEFVLTFDNTPTVKPPPTALVAAEARLPAVSSALLFEIFPFIMLFGENMVIQNVGKSLMQILPKMVNKKINEYFDIVRPLIEFSFNVVLDRSNNIFELMTVEPIENLLKGEGEVAEEGGDDGDDMGGLEEEVDKTMHLKGQMCYMAEWNVILFLCSPNLPNLDTLAMCGLFICDLSMHDFSRDLLLAGSQGSKELKELLDAQTKKSAEMQVFMKKMDKEMDRSNTLLHQMIPKEIAEKLKAGVAPIDTCEIYEKVTIIFSDVPQFADILLKIEGEAVVKYLNTMFGLFDNLTDRNEVYKVETVKDCFVTVAGAPKRIKDHAAKMMDMALDMRDAACFIPDPRPGNEAEHTKIRLGSHCGPIVAGIVGNKSPR